MNYNIEDLPDETLDSLMRKIQEEKTKRENKAYDELVNSFLDILSKLNEKYPFVCAGSFEDNDLDWSDIYDIIYRN